MSVASTPKRVSVYKVPRDKDLHVVRAAQLTANTQKASY
jgi:hypothetical protein